MVTEKALTAAGGEVAAHCLVDTNRHWIKLQAVSGPQQAIMVVQRKQMKDLPTRYVWFTLLKKN